MKKTIYVESHLMNHPRVQSILNRYKDKTVIPCQHHGEIFNRKNQNFRQQKTNPAIILAEKTGRKVIPSPSGFGIDNNRNYYFSHMLNCPFDCRYCFLQGMYQSAHHVIYVNYEDFMDEIKQTVSEEETPCTFFSGYNADSLALEPITHFAREFLPFFSGLRNATLELRSKSANIRELLKHPASKNIIVAFSLNPDIICDQHEYKAASLSKRIKAIKQASAHGYSVGVRIDPVIYCNNFNAVYRSFIEHIAKEIGHCHIHSISLGGLRFPAKMHQKIVKLYPSNKLLNQVKKTTKKQVSYPEQLEKDMLNYVQSLLSQHFSEIPQFNCTN